MFQERLREIRARIDGASALALVGQDGLVVETDLDESPVDLEATAAELVTRLKTMAGDERGIALQRVREMTIATDDYTLLLSAVAREYFLLLVLSRDSLLGRARFEARRAGLLLTQDLR